MVLTGISGPSQQGAVISVSRISDDSTSVRKDVTAVINTMEVMIVLEVIVRCRWPLVALVYASPETMWLRVQSAYIFHHKYPIPENSMINGNQEGHSSREASKSKNIAVKLTALLFIVHNDKGFPRLWLIKCYRRCNLILCRMIAYGWEFIQSGFPRSNSMTIRNWAITCLCHHSCECIFLSFWLKMGEGLLGVTSCCKVFLWNQALYSDRIRFLIPKM